jgi:hypothetical protein
MIKFSIGVALLTFSVIVGVYEYFEKTAEIGRNRVALQQTLSQRDQVSQISQRIEAIKRVTLARGQDQKSNIEKILQIDQGSGIEFRYINEASPDDPANAYFYRHTFEITGVMDFIGGVKLLNRLENIPGLVVYSVCANCTKPTDAAQLEKGIIFQIKGFAYVYNTANVL